MATRAVFFKYLLSSFRFRRKFTILKIRAWQRLQRFQIFVDRFVDLIISLHKQDIFHSRTNGYFGIFTNTGRHTRRSLMGKQECFRIFRITHAIIQQVPVKPVHACIIRMTGCTTLPVLETNGCIMEVHISLTNFSESQWSTQNLLLHILTVQIHRHQFRRIIVGSINFTSRSYDRTRTFSLCRNEVTDAIQESRIIRYIPPRFHGRSNHFSLFRFAKTFMQSYTIDAHQFLTTGSSYYDLLIIRSNNYRPRIGCSFLWSVQDDGSEPLSSFQINDG